MFRAISGIGVTLKCSINILVRDSTNNINKYRSFSSNILPLILPHLNGPLTVITSSNIPLHNVLSTDPSTVNDDVNTIETLEMLKPVIAGITQVKGTKLNYLSVNNQSSVLNLKVRAKIRLDLFKVNYMVCAKQLTELII